MAGDKPLGWLTDPSAYHKEKLQRKKIFKGTSNLKLYLYIEEEGFVKTKLLRAMDIQHLVQHNVSFVKKNWEKQEYVGNMKADCQWARPTSKNYMWKTIFSLNQTGIIFLEFVLFKIWSRYGHLKPEEIFTNHVNQDSCFSDFENKVQIEKDFDSPS